MIQTYFDTCDWTQLLSALGMSTNNIPNSLKRTRQDLTLPLRDIILTEEKILSVVGKSNDIENPCKPWILYNLIWYEVCITKSANLRCDPRYYNEVTGAQFSGEDLIGCCFKRPIISRVWIIIHILDNYKAFVESVRLTSSERSAIPSEYYLQNI